MQNTLFPLATASGFWALAQLIKAKSVDGKNDVIIPSLTYRRLCRCNFMGKYNAQNLEIVDENTLTPNAEMLEDAIDENTD